MINQDDYRYFWSKISDPTQSITDCPTHPKKYSRPIKTSLWIVTYKNPLDLEKNLESLFEHHNPDIFDMTVNIINNNTNFYINPKYEDKVKVWHNVLRPDNSVGHLGRNWNEAILAGIGDLNNPQCELLITSQDDVIWLPNWCETMNDAHKKYSFITQGNGDTVVSYLPEAIKKVGLWDERFSPSFYAEGDYFLRSLIWNKEKSSINDYWHGRVHNPLEKIAIEAPPITTESRATAKFETLTKAAFPWAVWWLKWNVSPTNWTEELIDNPPTSTLIPSIVMYPHFEINIEDIEKKNYAILY